MTMLFEQLWNGQIAPHKNCGRGDLEMEKLAQLIEVHKNALYNYVGEEQKKMLETYISCCDEYTYLATVHAFREGFSLASRLLSEVLGDIPQNSGE